MHTAYLKSSQAKKQEKADFTGLDDFPIQCCVLDFFNIQDELGYRTIREIQLVPTFRKTHFLPNDFLFSQRFNISLSNWFSSIYDTSINANTTPFQYPLHYHCAVADLRRGGGWRACGLKPPPHNLQNSFCGNANFIPK